ncbi:hypothetical protein RF11_11253 [Thelohanellus kitauei]|uniref:Cell cycle control protein 50A n=1 Tax=Thelohanellus kitauei TaxID=669202 RepID=A0A0C2IG80_THEKT|nr:hypothetical protein RF11_11253 [Thelohanellus kitauei]
MAISAIHQLKNVMEKWMVSGFYRAVLLQGSCLMVRSLIISDSFELFNSNNPEEKINMEYVPITSTDRFLFKNPLSSGSDLSSLTDKYIKPRWWEKDFFSLNPGNNDMNGPLYPDFVYWIKNEPFPTFLKPHRMIKSDNNLVNSKYVLTGDKLRKSIIIFNSDTYGSKSTKMLTFSFVSTSLCFILTLFAFLDHLFSRYEKRR